MSVKIQIQVLAKARFDDLVCDDCGRKHTSSEDHRLGLGSKCHPGAPLHAYYDKELGVVALFCAAPEGCGLPVFGLEPK